MKKFIFMGVIGLFLLGSCNSKSGEGHNHETEEHAHAGHDHEGHDHESENHDHEHEGSRPRARACCGSLPPAIATKSYCLRLRRRPPAWRRASSNRVLSIR